MLFPHVWTRLSAFNAHFFKWQLVVFHITAPGINEWEGQLVFFFSSSSSSSVVVSQQKCPLLV